MFMLIFNVVNLNLDTIINFGKLLSGLEII